MTGLEIAKEIENGIQEIVNQFKESLKIIERESKD